MAQLAHYLGTSGRGLETSVGVSYLIDEYYIRLAFAPLVMGGIPLPIVFCTPVLSWRDTQDGTSINHGVCIALCLLQKFPKERYHVTEES